MRNKAWVKKTMAMMVTATMLTSVSGCASKSEGVELSDTTVVAEVASVDGNVVTVTMGAISSSGSSGMGMAPGNGQGAGGNAPEKPGNASGMDGQVPEKPENASGTDGEASEKSESANGTSGDSTEKSDTQNKTEQQMPEKPSGEQAANGETTEKQDKDNTDSTTSQNQGEQASNSKNNAPQGGNGNAPGGMGSSKEQFIESDTVATVHMSSKTTIKEEDKKGATLAVGDVVRLTIDKKGKVTEVTILDMEVSSAENTGGAPDMGGQSSNVSYTAEKEYSEDSTIKGETISSTGTDENAILVKDGTVSVSDAKVKRSSSDSTGGDNSSFYGVGAAVLGTGGTTYVSNTSIDTDAAGGAGVFAYGDSKVYVADTTINTKQDTSGGLHAAGGGSLYAWNVTATTQGESAAAIRSDRGGGTMVVDQGTYTSNGTGSPAIYCTADIAVNKAKLTANHSEAVCIEGLNSLRLYDCDLTGNMGDNEQNDCKWNVILYQSMSGDSEVGNSTFEMVGGSLTAKAGGMFYTTNTESTFYVEDVDITYAKDNDFFLKCTGNSNARGWGSAGSNGADCNFTASKQKMEGNILWDSISNLNLYMLKGSKLTGAVVQDESNAGNGGDGTCNLSVSKDSTWVVTGNSTVTNLYNAGNIVDKNGNKVTIVDKDGNTLVKGNSKVKVTVSNYSETSKDTDAASSGSFSDYAVEKPEALS